MKSAFERCSSPQAEKSVLGAACIDSGIPAWLDLDPEDFFDAKNRILWEAMRALAADNRPIDVATLEAELVQMGKLDAIGGLAYVSEVALATPTADNVEHYAEIVRDAARRRGYLVTLSEAQTRIAADPQRAEEFLDEALGRLGQNRRSGIDVVSAKEAVRLEMRRIWDHYESRARGDQVSVGTLTGIRGLDRLTGGLPIGPPTMLGGRPKNGKSTTALAIAVNVCATYPDELVIWLSYEDPADTMSRRMLARASGVNYARIRAGTLGDDEMRDLMAGETAGAGPPNLRIVMCHGRRIAEVKRICLALAARQRVRMIVLDYIQETPDPFPSKGEKRTYQLEANVRDMAHLFAHLRCSGMILSQMKRNKDEPPRLDEFKDCGAIEQITKLALAVYCPLDSELRRQSRGELHILADSEGVAPYCLDLSYDLARQQIADWGMA